MKTHRGSTGNAKEQERKRTKKTAKRHKKSKGNAKEQERNTTGKAKGTQRESRGNAPDKQRERKAIVWGQGVCAGGVINLEFSDSFWAFLGVAHVDKKKSKVE